MAVKEESGLSLEQLARRLDGLQRENDELRSKVAALEASGTRREGTDPEGGRVSRSWLLSKAGAVARGGGRLQALLAAAAIVVILAVMALLAQGVPPATGGVGAEQAGLKAGAGSAIVHDDAGNMPPSTSSAIIHDDAGNMTSPVTGSGMVRYDPGHMPSIEALPQYIR